jgi:hypothetical protein
MVGISVTIASIDTRQGCWSLFSDRREVLAEKKKKNAEDAESHWSDSNRRPLDYESRALPLSYSGLSGKK